jgi:hypothetical protein
MLGVLVNSGSERITHFSYTKTCLQGLRKLMKSLSGWPTLSQDLSRKHFEHETGTVPFSVLGFFWLIQNKDKKFWK